MAPAPGPPCRVCTQGQGLCVGHPPSFPPKGASALSFHFCSRGGSWARLVAVGACARGNPPSGLAHVVPRAGVRARDRLASRARRAANLSLCARPTGTAAGAGAACVRVREGSRGSDAAPLPRPPSARAGVGCVSGHLNCASAIFPALSQTGSETLLEGSGAGAGAAVPGRGRGSGRPSGGGRRP